MPSINPQPAGIVPVVVRPATAAPEIAVRARELASALGLEFVAHDDPMPVLALTVGPEGLALHDADGGAGVRSAFAGRQPATQVSRRQPFGRAMGRGTRTVLDATAGLGHDSALLARMGFDVTAVERSPVLAALLADGCERAVDPALPAVLRAAAARVRVVAGDARTVMVALPADARPDVVYLDPMFPPKRKESALARKRIRVVRLVVGDDPDADGLLAAAQACALRRVVVKRPRRSEPVAGTPSFTVPGTLVRYDVYART